MSATTPRSTGQSSRSRVTGCNTCSATLEADQRYCVICGGRNPLAPDPAADHLASATRDSRIVRQARANAAGRRRGARLLVPALSVLAAFAIGVAVGATGEDSRGAGADSASRPAQSPSRPGANVIGQSSTGPIEDLAAYDPTRAKAVSDAAAIKRCQQQKGAEYLQCQKTLPDIVGTGPGVGQSQAGER